MLIIKDKVQYSRIIGPVCMYTQPIKMQDFVNKKGIVAGWGYNKRNVLSEQLHFLLMPIVDRRTCVNSNILFAPQSESKTFCAGFSAPSEGSTTSLSGLCGGDSGGGLTIFDGAQYKLLGIVSFTLGSTQLCDPQNYASFTDVNSFSDWIQANKK